MSLLIEALKKAEREKQHSAETSQNNSPDTEATTPGKIKLELEHSEPNKHVTSAESNAPGQNVADLTLAEPNQTPAEPVQDQVDFTPLQKTVRQATRRRYYTRGYLFIGGLMVLGGIWYWYQQQTNVYPMLGGRTFTPQANTAPNPNTLENITPPALQASGQPMPTQSLPATPEQNTQISPPPRAHETVAAALPTEPLAKPIIRVATKSEPVAKRTRSKPTSTKNKRKNTPKPPPKTQSKPRKKVSRPSQDSPKLLLQQAYALYQNEQYAPAQRKYARVLLIQPGQRDALLGQAAIAIRLNQNEPARQIYLNLLNQNAQDADAKAGLISLSAVDAFAAESQLKQLLDRKPNAVYLYFYLGNIYAAQQRWPDARNAFAKVAAHAPNNPDYSYNLAVSFDHLTDYHQALHFYTTALASSPAQSKRIPIDLTRKRITELRNFVGETLWP